MAFVQPVHLVPEFCAVTPERHTAMHYGEFQRSMPLIYCIIKASCKVAQDSKDQRGSCLSWGPDLTKAVGTAQMQGSRKRPHLLTGERSETFKFFLIYHQERADEDTMRVLTRDFMPVRAPILTLVRNCKLYIFLLSL